MSEMVERVARAVNAELSRVEELPRDDRALADRQLGDLLARAAILAMREPTEEMRERIGWTYAILMAAGRLPSDQDLSDDTEQLFWQVAIDEALK